MKFNLEPVKNWFGFTRRERRSATILLMIILLVIIFRYMVPEQNIQVENISDALSFQLKSEAENLAGTTRDVLLFPFNPNNASYDTLLKLGLDAREARTLINYRSNGGTFKKAEDIKKIYGLEEEKALSLIPFVDIGSDNLIQNVTRGPSDQKTEIDINTSDTALLESLPGIGHFLAVRIIKYGNLLGGYASAVQLKEVYGLSEETYGCLTGRVFADTTTLARININTGDYRVLSRHPYFERYEVSAILKYRELNGRISSLNDLTDNKLLTAEKAAKLRPYLNFE